MMTGELLGLWILFSLVMACILFASDTFPGRKGTWAELISLVLFFPGWLIVGFMAGLVLAAISAYKFLDKPIGKKYDADWLANIMLAYHRKKRKEK